MLRPLSLLGSLASLALIGVPHALDAQAAADSGTMMVTARLLVSGVDVKPVPLHQLLIFAAPASNDSALATDAMVAVDSAMAGDSAITGDSALATDSALDAVTSHIAEIRTDFEGRGTIFLAAGSYLLQSSEPVAVEGTQYRWSEVVTIGGGDTVQVELNNLNAHTVEVAAFVFDVARRAVFRLSAGLRYGTAFVVDCEEGLMVTNDHVIGAGKPLAVNVDPQRRVAVSIAGRDEAADLAIVRIHPGALGECVSLPVRRDQDRPVAETGDQVMAIGYPMSHGEATLTTGIVSGVRDGAVVSDVNINPGSSGGPVTNAQGEVIAVATFVQQEEAGAGMAGAVSVDRLIPLLDSTSTAVAADTLPALQYLPTPPSEEYDVADIRSIADTADIDHYKKMWDWDAGEFQIFFATPVSTHVRWLDHQREVTKDRRERADAAGIEDDISRADFAPVRDWMRLTGTVSMPVVSLGIDPKTGETSGSFWRTLAVGGKSTLRFKGDLDRVELIRNGEVMEPVGGGSEPLVADFESGGAKMSDIANHAHYIYLPDVFAPDSTGTPPAIILRLNDLKNPEDRTLFEVPKEIVERVWNDFEPYYRTVYPDRPFVRSDRDRFRSRFKDWCKVLGPKC